MAAQYRSGTLFATHRLRKHHTTITIDVNSTAHGMPAANPILVFDGLYLGGFEELAVGAEDVCVVIVLDVVVGFAVEALRNKDDGTLVVGDDDVVAEVPLIDGLGAAGDVEQRM